MPIDTQLTTLFCLIDGFCTDISEQVEQYMLTCGKIKRVRQSQICASEVITLLYAWGHEKNEIECLENSRMYQARGSSAAGTPIDSIYWAVAA